MDVGCLLTARGRVLFGSFLVTAGRLKRCVPWIETAWIVNVFGGYF
jgi:hypothetical protein